jgi:hypothetical protein
MHELNIFRVTESYNISRRSGHVSLKNSSYSATDRIELTAVHSNTPVKK